MDFIASIGTVLVASLVVFVGCFIVVPTLLAFLRFLGVYVVVEERQCLI